VLAGAQLLMVRQGSLSGVRERDSDRSEAVGVDEETRLHAVNKDALVMKLARSSSTTFWTTEIASMFGQSRSDLLRILLLVPSHLLFLLNNPDLRYTLFLGRRQPNLRRDLPLVLSALLLSITNQQYYLPRYPPQPSHLPRYPHYN
jgi:hypothetical protein